MRRCHEEVMRWAREKVGETPSRIGKRNGVVVPRAQMRLPLVGERKAEQIEKSAYPEHGAPTERHEEMADDLRR